MAGAKHPQQLIFENVSPATRMLEKRRQMYEVQDALENQKARFAKEEEAFKVKEDKLRQKDLQLQHQLFRFNKFLQDNEAKRRRAETRATEECAQIKQKDDEIRELERQLEESNQTCQELSAEVERNMKYEEFLDRVKDENEDYSEILDLVKRFETLEIANKDLMQLQTASDDKIEALRNEYQNYRKEQEMDMLAFTNKIATLQSDLEEWHKKRQELESTADDATQEDAKNSLHFGQILMSVDNLYLRCTTRKAIRHDDTVDMRAFQKDGDEHSYRKKQQAAIAQLSVILAYLKDFKDITKTLSKDKNEDEKRKKAANKGPEAAEPIPEPKFSVTAAEPARGDRGSQASGSNSHGNTRDLSRNVRSGDVLQDAGGGEGTPSPE